MLFRFHQFEVNLAYMCDGASLQSLLSLFDLKQFFCRPYRLIQIISLDRQHLQILPQFPARSANLNRLLDAQQSLHFFLGHLHETRRHIGPCIRLALIYSQYISKCIDCLLPILKSHVPTAKQEPRI